MRICIFWRPSLVHCSWEGRSPIDVKSQRSMYCTVLSVPVLCSSCIVPEPRNCTSTWYKNSIVLQTSTAFSTPIRIDSTSPAFRTSIHARRDRYVCVWPVVLPAMRCRSPPWPASCGHIQVCANSDWAAAESAQTGGRTPDRMHQLNPRFRRRCHRQSGCCASEQPC